MVETCAALGVAAARRDGHPGCWCDADGLAPRKIGALGLRVERGVSYHGIALNVTVDLADFDLIDPCGMPGVASTSIARELGRTDAPRRPRPSKRAARIFAPAFAARHRRAPRVRSRTDAIDGERPVRAPQGPDHGLVGRHDRRSGVPPRSVRPGGRAGRRPTVRLRQLRRTRATASARGCSRTSRSTSSAPTARHASSTGPRPRPGLAGAGAGDRHLADGHRAARRASAAPRGRHASSSRRSSTGARDALADAARRPPDRVPHGRPELGRPGRRADEPPVPRPVRPAADPAPDRRGAGRCRAVRDPRGGVPVLPARPRGVAPPGPARLGGPRQRRLRAVRLALAVRDLDRAAPPRRRLRAGDERRHQGHRRGAAPGPRQARRERSTGRRTTSSCTRRRCASRSTARTTGTGRSTRGCARSPASSWEPGCRSTPSRRRTRSRNCSAAPIRREVDRVDVGRCPSAPGVTSGGDASSLAHRACAAHRPRAPTLPSARSPRGPRPINHRPSRPIRPPDRRPVPIEAAR